MARGKAWRLLLQFPLRSIRYIAETQTGIYKIGMINTSKELLRDKKINIKS